MYNQVNYDAIIILFFGMLFALLVFIQILPRKKVRPQVVVKPKKSKKTKKKSFQPTPKGLALSINLKRLRKKNNLTQKELSEKIKVSKYTYVAWERGKYFPQHKKQLTKLAKALNTTTKELLREP